MKWIMLDERDKNQGWAGQGFFPRGGAGRDSFSCQKNSSYHTEKFTNELVKSRQNYTQNYTQTHRHTHRQTKPLLNKDTYF